MQLTSLPRSAPGVSSGGDAGIRNDDAGAYSLADDLPTPSRPVIQLETRIAGFNFRLEREDGSPADPPTFHTVVPTWRPGDTIPLGADRTLRVSAIRDDDADQPPALVVEPVRPR
jgi:hypothetical protein